MAKYLQRIQALQLRRKGTSIKTIAREVGIAKSTVSLWCRDMKLTEKQIIFLTKNREENIKLGQLRGAESKRNKRMHVIDTYIDLGKEKFRKVSDSEFFVFGLALYLCEGAKSHRRFVFTNSDPSTIRIMLRWLKVFYSIPHDRVGLRVQIHEMHKPREAKIQNFWRSYLNFPSQHPVAVNYFHNGRKKVYENYDTYYGVMHLRLLKGTDFSYRIQGLIAGITSALNTPA